jgi:DNA polymerase-1
MRIVFDIEVNSLKNPKHIWCVCCKDLDTGTVSIFRKVTEDETEKKRFLDYVLDASLLVGHNILEFDLPILDHLLGFKYPSVDMVVDTLLVSRLVNYSRVGGHSLESYGEEYGLPKIHFNDFTQYSPQMEEYCVRDVEINHLLYQRFHGIIHDAAWLPSIRLEHDFQLIVNALHNNGFAFDQGKAEKLLTKVNSELGDLDEKIREAFPPRLKPIREITPRLTGHGTLHKGDFRWVRGGDLSEFNGGPFCRCEWVEFNPSSPRQVIGVLSESGWSPTDKTKTHIETEREVHRLKYRRGHSTEIDSQVSLLYTKLKIFEKFGWKINEANLSTLPSSAPSPARLLARRILVESRRRTLTEWLGLVQPDGRIHGKFYGIGAWTHRMAHQQPNTANIPTDAKLYGREMRSLWRAPRNRLLVGVDAEGIQLRIFAHYVNNKELIDSLINGNKSDGTDPHSLNRSIIGDICESRQTAKRYVYALFLGAGRGKLASILGRSEEEAEEALARILQRYPGFDQLRREQFPRDAKRGYFIGLDGRRVPIPGATEGDRRHLAMSGYLQNGEAIIMKKACVLWTKELANEDAKIVNFVHDEWQIETPNDMDKAIRVAKTVAQSLTVAGNEYGLRCPMAGSYWNEDHQDYTIGPNWSVTH